MAPGSAEMHSTRKELIYTAAYAAVEVKARAHTAAPPVKPNNRITDMGLLTSQHFIKDRGADELLISTIPCLLVRLVR
jgi:hypothetical protein